MSTHKHFYQSFFAPLTLPLGALVAELAQRRREVLDAQFVDLALQRRGALLQVALDALENVGDGAAQLLQALLAGDDGAGAGAPGQHLNAVQTGVDLLQVTRLLVLLGRLAARGAALGTGRPIRVTGRPVGIHHTDTGDDQEKKEEKE